MTYENHSTPKKRQDIKDPKTRAGKIRGYDISKTILFKENILSQDVQVFI